MSAEPHIDADRADVLVARQLEARAEAILLDLAGGDGAIRAEIAAQQGGVREDLTPGPRREALRRVARDRSPEAARLLREADAVYWRMVLRHDGMIWKHARRHARMSGVPADEVRSHLLEGWLRGAIRWDPDRATKLSTHAARWGLAQWQRASDHQAAIVLPKASGGAGSPRGNSGFGRLRIASLDAPVNPDAGDRTLGETLVDEDAPDPSAWAGDAAKIRSAVGALPDRERLVLLARAEGVEFHRLGGRLGVCCERVRQIEASAIAAVRQHIARPASSRPTPVQAPTRTPIRFTEDAAPATATPQPAHLVPAPLILHDAPDREPEPRKDADMTANTTTPARTICRWPGCTKKARTWCPRDYQRVKAVGLDHRIATGEEAVAAWEARTLPRASLPAPVVVDVPVALLSPHQSDPSPMLTDELRDRNAAAAMDEHEADLRDAERVLAPKPTDGWDRPTFRVPDDVDEIATALGLEAHASFGEIVHAAKALRRDLADAQADADARFRGAEDAGLRAARFRDAIKAACQLNPEVTYDDGVLVEALEKLAEANHDAVQFRCNLELRLGLVTSALSDSREPTDAEVFEAIETRREPTHAAEVQSLREQLAVAEGHREVRIRRIKVAKGIIEAAEIDGIPTTDDGPFVEALRILVGQRDATRGTVDELRRELKALREAQPAPTTPGLILSWREVTTAGKMIDAILGATFDGDRTRTATALRALLGVAHG